MVFDALEMFLNAICIVKGRHDSPFVQVMMSVVEYLRLAMVNSLMTLEQFRRILLGLLMAVSAYEIFWTASLPGMSLFPDVLLLLERLNLYAEDHYTRLTYWTFCHRS